MSFFTQRISFLFFLLLVPLVVFCQLNQANEFYETNQFANAIPLFEKKAVKNNREAIEKLADCYFQIKEYKKAEEWYEKAVAFENPEPIILFQYAQVLKNNSHPEKAKEVFLRYKKLINDNPYADILIAGCDSVELWKERRPYFEAIELRALNSPLSDFSAVPFRKGIVFVSERSKDLNSGNLSGWNQHPFLSVLYSEMRLDSTIFSKATTFSRKINTDYHNGPVWISKDQKTVYFTRVDLDGASKKVKIIKPQLYVAKIGDDKRTHIEPFQYNDERYSFAHPCLSPDENFLFFASDMPGTIGGMDIYMCSKEGSGWGAPVNLGPVVNTSFNEVFPSMDNNGVLYFSSTGHPGYGGMDVFSTKLENRAWTKPSNLYSPLNSPFDDFGIYFTKPGKRGYISSNRPGGKGNDDIYVFNSILEQIFPASIKGTLFSADSIAAANLTVNLINENGDVIRSTKTDEQGNFEFVNLPAEDNYIVALNQEEVGLKTINSGSKIHGNVNIEHSTPSSKARIVVVNNERLVVRELTPDEKGVFKFEALPAEYSMLKEIAIEDADFKMPNINSISGQLLFKDGKAAQNLTVQLINDSGDKIATYKSDKDGKFAFKNLSPTESYIIKVQEDETAFKDLSGLYGNIKYNNNLPGTLAKLEVCDSHGKVKNNLAADKKGFFFYKELPSDFQYMSLMQEDAVALKSIKKNEISGVIMLDSRHTSDGITVKLLDQNSKTLKTAKTNSKGFFVFENLPADGNYIVALNEEDPLVKPYKSSLFGRLKYNDKVNAPNVALALTDAANKKKTIVKSDKLGFFAFETLNQDEKFLTLMDQEEIALYGIKVRSISGAIMDQNGQPVPNAVVKLVNEKGELIQIGKTDSKGAFSYNKLSPDQNYLILVDETDPAFNGKISGVYGQIKYNDNLPAPNAKFVIASNQGDQLIQLTSDKNGVFYYETLPSDYKYLALTESVEETEFSNSYVMGRLMKDSVTSAAGITVSLKDKNGNIIEQTKTDEKGNFVFTRLPSDESYLIAIEESDLGPNINLNNLVAKVKSSGTSAGTLEINSAKGNKQFQTDGKGVFAYQTLPTTPTYLTMLDETETMFAALSNSAVVRGTLVRTDNMRASDVKVKLLDEKGNVIGTTTTDRDGNFRFEKLPADGNYLVALDDAEAGYKDGAAEIFGRIITEGRLRKPSASLAIVDANNSVVTNIASDRKGFFSFQKLPSEESYMMLLDEQEPQLLAKRVTVISGTFNTGTGDPLSNVIVKLVNEKGKVIATYKTNAKGEFIFSNLPYEQSYIVQLNADDPAFKEIDINSVFGRVRYNNDDPGTRTKIAITSGGKNIKVLAANRKGFFQYQVLQSDERFLALMDENDVEINLPRSISFVGKAFGGYPAIQPASGLKVIVMNSSGNKIRSTITEPAGTFSINNLPFAESYTLLLDGAPEIFQINGEIKSHGSPIDANFDLKAKEKENDLKVIFANNKFKIEKAKAPSIPKDIVSSKPAPVNTSKPETANNSISNYNASAAQAIIYFPFEGYVLNEQDKQMLDRLSSDLKGQKQKIYVHGYTDIRGTENLNYVYSDLRARSVVNYLNQKGIPRASIIKKSYGQRNPAIPCKSDNDCTEEQHSKNRRVEIFLK